MPFLSLFRSSFIAALALALGATTAFSYSLEGPSWPVGKVVELPMSLRHVPGTPNDGTPSWTAGSAPAAAEWDTLLAGSVAHAIFAGRPFQESWWDAFCSNSSCSCQLHLLVLREGGTLIGVAPFYLAVQTAAGLAEEQEAEP